MAVKANLRSSLPIQTSRTIYTAEIGQSGDRGLGRGDRRFYISVKQSNILKNNRMGRIGRIRGYSIPKNSSDIL
jgi:hypothetical protein